MRIKNHKLKIDKSYFIYFCALIPFFLSITSYAIFNSTFSNLLLFLKAGVFLIVVSNFLKKRKINSFLCALLVYLFVWLFSVIINQTSIFSYIKEMAVIISYVFIMDHACQKGKFNKCIKAFCDILLILLLINLIVLIIKPEGIYGGFYSDKIIYGVDIYKTRYNVLGLDNSITVILVVAIAAFILSIANNSVPKLYKFFFVVAIIGNIFYLKSSTLQLAMLIIVVTFLISFRNKKIFTTKTILLLTLLVFLVIVIFEAQEIFSIIIVNILHKDLTLTSRSNIWNSAIKYIMSSPIFGHGIDTFGYVWVDRNAHNLFIQIAAQSGVVGIIALSDVFRKSFNVIKSYNRWSIYINCCMFAFLICSISEVYSQHWMFIMIYFTYISHKKLIFMKLND